MADQVRVDDLDVFRVFRGAVMKFAQTASQALMNVDAQAARTLTWLETEQTAYWQGQLRKRTEAVSRAAEAVRQKKIFRDASGRIPSAVEEEKHLAKCKAAVLEAQEKILAVRKAVPRLQKEIEAYRGGVSALGGTLTAEIPKAVALLDALAGRMEEYIQLAAPGEPAGAGAGMQGDAFTAPPPAETGEMARPAEEQKPAAAEEPKPQPTEGERKNVAG